MAEQNNPVWGPASKAKPRQMVILCHGLGADGHDLIDLAPFWGNALPDAVFVAPHGPEPHDMAAGTGLRTGRQWFPIVDIDLKKFGIGVRRAALALNAIIDEQLAKYGLPPDAYALMGFSQGAMTTLFTGLRRQTAPRAILAFSGGLIDPDSLKAELRNHAPVLLAHGEADQVVPALWSREAEKVLQAAGVPVQTVFSPKLEHGIDEIMLTAGAIFLQKAFAA